MNIQRTSSQPRPLSRQDRKGLYEKAKTEAKETQDNLSEAFQSSYSAADRKALKVGGGVGLGTAAALIGFGLATANLGTVGATVEYAGLSILMGFCTGMLSGSFTQVHYQHQADKMLDKELRPLLRERNAAVTVTRENYRDALIEEIKDDGVVEATQKTWDDLRAVERNPRYGGEYRDARAKLDTEVSRLEQLTDSRRADGWEGRLANLEDNPTFFADQLDTVHRYPNLRQVLEN